jgi:hypothetical protein
VDRLCAKDGGLKIYETVTLPPEKFNEYNQINFFRATEHENALGPDYIWKDDEIYLQPGGDPNANPSIQSQGLNFPVAYYRFLGILYSSGFADNRLV